MKKQGWMITIFYVGALALIVAVWIATLREMEAGRQQIERLRLQQIDRSGQ